MHFGKDGMGSRMSTNPSQVLTKIFKEYSLVHLATVLHHLSPELW